MIEIDHAVEIVRTAAAEARADRMLIETVSLEHARGRILREDVLATEDSPPFDKSIRDGFAVRASDIQSVPVTLEVLGESRAGLASGVTVRPGACCEIMTGAPMPDGADTVVMVEHTERPTDATVRILRSMKEGAGLLRRGAEARSGERLIAAGHRIGLADIGLLAGAGKSHPKVSQKPRVAIVATGDELVLPNETPGHGRIRNSNSFTLATQTAAAGAEPILLGIARDTLPSLREKIGAALEHDIVLVSGGVSMGKYDLVEQVFAEFGVAVAFDKVAMKPGKPTVFGRRGGTFVFGLPGNPVSTIVSFHMFVRPVIRSLLRDDSPADLPRATLEVPTHCDPERAAIVPALVHLDGVSYRIRTASWKGSSDLTGLARSNALVMIPKREGMLEAGEIVPFLFLE